MILSYLLTAYRNFIKYKGYSIINILSLGFGLFCFILIMMYVVHERSFDEQYSAGTYRLALEVHTGSTTTNQAQTPPVWTRLMEQEYPEIEATVRVKPPRQTWMVSNEERNIHFAERKWVFADSNVFKFFNIPLIEGNPDKALEAKSTVVLSESMAKKYFGDGVNAIGKNLMLDKVNIYEVTGVMKDMPESNHFHFDFIAGLENLDDTTKYYGFRVPEGPFPFTYDYIRLKEGADPHSLEAKFPAFIQQRTPIQFRQNGEVKIFLQNTRDIHLTSNLENEIEPNGSKMLVLFFMSIGIFLILIACANFINMATARSVKRVKEVGIRKTLGAEKSELVIQFIGETLLMVLLSLFLALTAVYLALPAFNSLANKAIGFSFLLDWRLASVIITAVVVTVVLSGSYPSLVLSSVRAAEVLKSSQNSGTGGRTILRKSLIVFQFSISAFLIISTLVVYNQMQFMENKDLGLDKEQVVVVQLTDPTPINAFRTFKSVISANPAVKGVTASFSAPAYLVFQSRIKGVNTGSDEVIQAQNYFHDYDFVETLGIKLIAGKDVTLDNPNDTLNTCVINETAMRKLGYTNPQDVLGREIMFPDFGNSPNYRVIGVTEDFHNMSVRETVPPTVMVYGRNGFYAFVKIDVSKAQDVLPWMKQRWEEIVPGYTFDYSFLDENFDRLYKSEKVLNVLLTFFAGLTVFVACLGLLGLCSFMTQQRSKEIGIRKVNGASVPNIIGMFSKEFLQLIVIGYVVGAPLAFIVMSKWLDSFAYRIDMEPSFFVLALIFTVGVMALTVGYQIIKAARTSPTKSLRTE
jgi:putative ABC transport system permease protein